MAAWHLAVDDIDDMALGCAMLGSGGGGDPHCAVILLKAMLEKGVAIRILDPADLADDAVTITTGYVGAPITLTEKLIMEGEIVAAIDAMRRRLPRPVSALIAAEIGGFNGLVPLVAAGMTGLPVVNADGMGRAFPRNDQVAFAIYGHSAAPTIVSSEAGEIIVLETGSNARLETFARALSVTMGSKCFTVDYPLTGRDVRAHAVPRTLSLARDIGRAIRIAGEGHDPLDTLRTMLHACWGIASLPLFEGRVTSREHTTEGGFDVGRAIITRPGHDRDTLTLDFQNEFLVAWRDGTPVASTPDIISVVDSHNLCPITSDGIRYGQRVKVIALSAPALMRSERALEAIGPRAFGYDFDYRPIESGADSASDRMKATAGPAGA